MEIYHTKCRAKISEPTETMQKSYGNDAKLREF